jgi:polyribonucleotide nucleotidyltransferase
MTAEVKVGRIYTGRVVSIKEFGAFVEIAPETDGLCHVSELSNRYINRVTDVVQMGDEIKVKVILIDDTGRIKLSRKAAMQELGESDPEPEGGEEDFGDEGGPLVDEGGGPDAIGERPQGEFRPREGGGGGRGGDRGGRGGDRGGRGGGGGGRGGDRGGRGGGGRGGDRGGRH